METLASSTQIGCCSVGQRGMDKILHQWLQRFVMSCSSETLNIGHRNLTQIDFDSCNLIHICTDSYTFTQVTPFPSVPSRPLQSHQNSFTLLPSVAFKFI